MLVKLTHSGVDEFVEKYATNLSPGGMFIRSREPKPVGTAVNFRVEIAGGLRVLQGSAVVKWTRGANDPAGPAGMGVEFSALDQASEALVIRMLSGKTATPPPAPPPLVAPVAPVVPAIAAVVPVAAAKVPPMARATAPGRDAVPSPQTTPARPHVATVRPAPPALDLDALVSDLGPPEPPAAAAGADEPLDSGFEISLEPNSPRRHPPARTKSSSTSKR